MNKFKEEILTQDFAKESLTDAKKLIAHSTSFTVIGLPGMGISMFLRFLATQKDIGKVIHIDVNELSEFNKDNFWKLFYQELGGKKILKNENLIKESKLILTKLAKTNNRIVIIFNRFDKLNPEFSENFFANLRSLRDIDKEKIVMIFAANTPLTTQCPEAFLGGNLHMFSTNLYLPLFSKTDLKELLLINAPENLQNPYITERLKLSGGHYQLLLLLLKSDYSPNYLQDPVILIQLKQFLTILNYQQKKQLEQIVLGKDMSFLDPLLLKYGIINTKKELFSPLFRDYILSTLKIRLSDKEAALLKLLKQQENKIISKEEIFSSVWQDNEEVTDWALDSLIYRLRKNPVFASRYLIENQKRKGYRLVKI